MATTDRDAAALQATETVLSALRDLDERDPAIDELIATIEDDRARLLASVIGSQAIEREPLPLRLH